MRQGQGADRSTPRHPVDLERALEERPYPESRQIVKDDRLIADRSHVNFAKREDPQRRLGRSRRCWHRSIRRRRRSSCSIPDGGAEMREEARPSLDGSLRWCSPFGMLTEPGDHRADRVGTGEASSRRSARTYCCRLAKGRGRQTPVPGPESATSRARPPVGLGHPTIHPRKSPHQGRRRLRRPPRSSDCPAKDKTPTLTVMFLTLSSLDRSPAPRWAHVPDMNVRIGSEVPYRPGFCLVPFGAGPSALPGRLDQGERLRNRCGGHATIYRHRRGGERRCLP